MNNNVIFAAAGSGKTYGICQESIKLSSLNRKFILILTYTNEGIKSIENEYRKQNLGVIDSNVVIKTWYSFLLSELIKPYQRLLKVKRKHYKDEFDFEVPENFVKSIAFYDDTRLPYFNANHIQYYFNNAQDIYRDEVSLLATKCIIDSNNLVIERLEGIYSSIFIDELQDYAGWDLEVIQRIFKSNLKVTCVGDYRQATFRTNNSIKFKKYRDDKIIDFFLKEEKNGFCQVNYNNISNRLNSFLCEFANNIFKDGIKIQPNNKKNDLIIENIGVYLLHTEFAKIYCDYYEPTILRYDRTKDIAFENNCKQMNYGESKGCTFDRVMIFPVSTVLPFLTNESPINSPQTRMKFYVACTRARYSIVFVVDEKFKSDSYEETTLNIGDTTIPAYKYRIKS